MSQDGVTVEKLADGSQLQSYADGSSLQVSVAPNNEGGYLACYRFVASALLV